MTKKIRDIQPPIASKKDFIIETHGHKRNDPYFWMRLTDEQKSAKTKDAQTTETYNYLDAENEYTKSIMAHTESFQEKLFDEIVGRIKKDDVSVPYYKNEYWYYTRYEDGKEYPIYCRKHQSLEAEEIVFFDANIRAEGLDYYSASGLTVSPDNTMLAFAEDTVSRRVYTYRFKNLITGEVYNDELQDAQPGGAWADDNTTFFYTIKNKVSLLSEKIARHEIGKSAENDVIVYQELDPSFYIGVSRTKSGKYITIYNKSTLVSDYHILKSDDPLGTFTQFSLRTTNHEYDIEHYKDQWYVVTNWEAVNFRLMTCHVNDTKRDNWKEVLPHRDDVLLEDIDVFENYLVVSERGNALTHLRVRNQSTQVEHYLSFAEAAYVAYTSNNREFDTDRLRFVYGSLTTPMSTIDYNMETREQVIKKRQEVVGGHNPANYTTERLFAPSRDGVGIPLSVVYHKSTKLSTETPLLLYAYGSYGASMDPWFSSTRLSLIDRGFVYVIAHIRGGQEMGRQWYEDGKMFNKINTFNDFIDASRYLIEKDYTSPRHLYAMGGSAGGLLMGAIINMAPELYRGVIAAVPFVDVVSTMLDETIPLTTNEFDQWGNPKEKDAYNYMLSYSPYDQVTRQAYPNMLVTTGLFDSQVQYWEPAKWVAKLRDYKTDDNVLLLHTNMEAGHGGASGRFKRHKETALEYAFFLDLEGYDMPQND